MSVIRSQPLERPVEVVASTPGDLAELMASFTEVTSRLEETHAVLRGEVARLTSELQQANERLRRSERLAELGEMAAGIAHEIRNPLGSISLYSEILEQDLEGDEEGAQTARKIGSSVRRLDAIVRDVLDFARDLRVRPEPVDTLPLWSVLLHNDDVNDMHHVVDTICMVTPLSMERAARVMIEAHNDGLALVCQTHREVAELYRERFQSRGLTCTIEPAR